VAAAGSPLYRDYRFIPVTRTDNGYMSGSRAEIFPGEGSEKDAATNLSL
jgi:hypothetical protein